MNERNRELALQVDLMRYPSDGINIRIERFAELVRADEREACAKVCDEREKPNLYGVRECAEAIRARGKK